MIICMELCVYKCTIPTLVPEVTLSAEVTNNLYPKRKRTTVWTPILGTSFASNSRESFRWKRFDKKGKRINLYFGWKSHSTRLPFTNFLCFDCTTVVFRFAISQLSAFKSSFDTEMGRPNRLNGLN